jgi:hypothetical protein
MDSGEEERIDSELSVALIDPMKLRENRSLVKVFKGKKDGEDINEEDQIMI